MIKRLLNPNTLLKITLILTTLLLLLLPSTAWATKYTTTGTVRTVSGYGSATHGWDIDNSSSKWQITHPRGSEGINPSNQNYLPFKLNKGESMTLTTSKPTSESGNFRKIILNGLDEKLSTTVTFGSDTLTSSSTGVFAPSSPITWGNDDAITITITNKDTEGGITYTINSITFLTGTLSNKVFSWGELTASNGYDISGITKSENEGNTTLQGHCEAGTQFHFPLTATESPAISYSSNNTSVAQVDNDGTVTIKGAEQATITATPEGTDDYYYASYSYTINITNLDEYYNITVADMRITSGNASDIFHDEKVSFTPATVDNSNNILTLNGAKLSSEAKPVIVSNLQNLVIKLIGTGNRLECSGNKSVINSTNANGFLSITNDNSGAAASLILATEGGMSVISGFAGMACTL